jgi:RepB DNA-primase N-terminal domain
MNAAEKTEQFIPSAPEYILDNFDAADRIAILVLNRDFGETIQRITSAQKAASPEFQAWLRYKNANGSDIYVGMNPLKKDASTRTKEDIASIKHLYIDLDQGGQEALEAIKNSNAVPRPNYVLNSSPERHQVVWRVEGMNLEEAEALLPTMAHEFGGDPAATDATRVLRIPGFANKKYETNFYVEARRGSTDTYHLRDFKLHVDAHHSPRHSYDKRITYESPARTNLTQSEHDWAFAKRALARGDDPEEIIRRIADYRRDDKPDPIYYARLTVGKAQSQLEGGTDHGQTEIAERIDVKH